MLRGLLSLMAAQRRHIEAPAAPPHGVMDLDSIYSGRVNRQHYTIEILL